MGDEDKKLRFHEMGLDDRLLKAIAKLGWPEPTIIQERSIPLILDGKDLLARGRTGSGKTGAFAVPLIQKILSAKQTAREQSVRALLLAPSKELARQICSVVNSLTSSCGRSVRCVNLAASATASDAADVAAQKALLVGDLPDIVVGTPARVLAHMQEGHLQLKESLEMLVIDEADLIFSFGYEADIKAILSRLPSIFQSVLTSATLSDDVNKLKKLVLHNPVVLKLEEPQLPEASQLTQYQIKVEEEDKFVLMYALFKLNLVQGKTIVFVNSVDRCYKMRLYLEQFAIPCCVLNSELPVATRCHIVSQFNAGVYDVIIASDEKFLDEGQPAANDNKKKKVDGDKERSKRKKDKESGVARGIDFQFVSNVVNFDFPPDADSYIHRVGRTARGNNKGTALSLVSAKEVDRLDEVEIALRKQMSTDNVFKAYQFKMDELDGFKYRARDAWRSVTKIAVREARLKEIKRELLNSTKLQAHFQDNPRDAQLLRHDKALHTVRRQAHLKNVPEYIVPQTLKHLAGIGGGGKRRRRVGAAASGSASSSSASERVAAVVRGMSAAKKKFRKRQTDPLKAMAAAAAGAKKRR